jgi:hypothetical protein
VWGYKTIDANNSCIIRVFICCNYLIISMIIYTASKGIKFYWKKISKIMEDENKV